MHFRTPPWVNEHPLIYTFLVVFHFVYAVALFETVSVVYAYLSCRR